MERINQHTQKYYTCKRLRMLQWLMEKGFKPCETIPDARNPVKYKNWLFENTIELSDAVCEYFAMIDNK